MLAASTLLLVSALMALNGGGAEISGEEAALLSRGWQPAEKNPCPRESGFYELEGESESAEVFLTPAGRTLSAHLPLPEPPTICRAIEQPNFIEEIL